MQLGHVKFSTGLHSPQCARAFAVPMKAGILGSLGGTSVRPERLGPHASILRLISLSQFSGDERCLHRNASSKKSYEHLRKPGEIIPACLCENVLHAIGVPFAPARHPLRSFCLGHSSPGWSSHSLALAAGLQMLLPLTALHWGVPACSAVLPGSGVCSSFGMRLKKLSSVMHPAGSGPVWDQT